jgi:hypothetical protein
MGKFVGHAHGEVYFLIKGLLKDAPKGIWHRKLYLVSKTKGDTTYSVPYAQMCFGTTQN